MLGGESGERGGGVVGVCPIAEDLEEREVGGVIGGGREGLDLRSGEELGEDEGVGCGGCAGDQVDGSARGGGGFGEC